MLLIGFGNKARHGKDTAAEAIRDYYESKNSLFLAHGQIKAIKNVGVYKFASALYQEVNEALKNNIWDTRTVYGEPFLLNKSGKEIVDGVYTIPTNATARSVQRLPDWVQPSAEYEPTELAPYGKHPKLLQWWGTEFRRAQDPDYWVKKLAASIPGNTNIALVSDVRFVNEADYITGAGGYNVNVSRINSDGSSYFSTDRAQSHPSEIALDNYNWQFRLTNHEGHKALLEEQAITLAEYLRGLK